MELVELLPMRTVGGRKRRYGLFKCPNCSTVTEVRADTGKTRSVCASCANKEAGDKRKTHGMSKTRLNSTWRNMKDRALNPNNPKHNIYKNKGMATEWLTFGNFAKWALENGYKDTLTIDRIDSSKGYYPDNCQWVTLAVNSGKDSTRDSYGKNKTIKVSNSQVLEIVHLYRQGLTQQNISEIYCVARTTISYILKKFQSAETIPNGSTLQVNGSGSGVNDVL